MQEFKTNFKWGNSKSCLRAVDNQYTMGGTEEDIRQAYLSSTKKAAKIST